MSFNLHTSKTKPRLLSVTESVRCYPRIILSGAWLRDWGFTTGQSISVFYVNASVLLLRPGTFSQWCDLSKYCAQATNGLTLPAKSIRHKPHPVTVSESERYVPQITITGAWLCDWGITTGDRVSVTQTDDGDILIKVIMPASAWREIKRKKKLEQEVAFAWATLECHKAAHPYLYHEAPKISRKHTTASKSPKTIPPSLFDQIMTNSQEPNAAVAAHSTTPPVPA